MKIQPQAIILAAGKGSRLGSDTPKILQKVGDKTIAERNVHLFKALGILDPVFVVGYKKEQVVDSIRKVSLTARFVHQEVLSGTATAVQLALPLLDPSRPVFIMMGDHPFYTPETLKNLLRVHVKTGAVFSIISCLIDHPSSHARVIRDKDGRISHFQETKELGEAPVGSYEVNLGSFMLEPGWAAEALSQVKPSVKTSEYYLTNLVPMAYEQGRPIAHYHLLRYEEAIGINHPHELEEVRRVAEKLSD